jgi:antitoxin component YwqK of YwqJK toxin-antitoxin module
VRSAIEYKNAKQHGPATYWDDKDRVARIEQWENGQQAK